MMGLYWDEAEKIICVEPPTPREDELRLFGRIAGKRYQRAGVGPVYVVKELHGLRGIRLDSEDGETTAWVSPRAIDKTYIEVLQTR